MFKAKIESGIIVNAVRAVLTLSREVRIHISEVGVLARVVDPGNVCMVFVSLQRQAFDYYGVSEPSLLDLGLDLERVTDVLKSAKKDEYIDIEHLVEKSRIKFVLDKLSYSLALVNMDTIRKEPKVPQIDLPVRVVMDGKEFSRAVKAAEKVSDYVLFDANEEGLHIASVGETSDMSLNVPKEDLEVFDMRSVKSASSTFDLGYMSDIAKSLVGSNLVEIMLGNDYPINVKSYLADGKCEIEYILAPRVVDD